MHKIAIPACADMTQRQVDIAVEDMMRERFPVGPRKMVTIKSLIIKMSSLYGKKRSREYIIKFTAREWHELLNKVNMKNM